MYRCIIYTKKLKLYSLTGREQPTISAGTMKSKACVALVETKFILTDIIENSSD